MLVAPRGKTVPVHVLRSGYHRNPVVVLETVRRENSHMRVYEQVPTVGIPYPTLGLLQVWGLICLFRVLRIRS